VNYTLLEIVMNWKNEMNIHNVDSSELELDVTITLDRYVN
jgi:hypothetical protein